jgi:DNA-binding GntR family transcriptional regulator
VTREVLARLHERGTIRKDRGSHWIAGPLSARLLDEQHEVRRVLEPAALLMAASKLGRAALDEMMARLDAAAAVGPTISTTVMDVLEADLHDTCLAAQSNRRITGSIAQVHGARLINRLFATHVAQHDESNLLSEHRLVLGHLRLGDAEGAAAALRYHLEADHNRTRERLKVLSVFADPAVARYLIRMF